MTCIVGLVSDGVVHMAADSAGVGGLDLRVRSPKSKLFLNGKLLFGCTTSFRMIDLLRDVLSPPAVQEGQTPHAYVVKTLIPAIRQCFKDGGFATTKDGREMGGTFLLGFRGALFTVYDDYQVAIDQDDFAACGSGEAYAMGSMHATRGIVQEPVVRLSMALSAAERYCAGVRGPVDYLSLEAKQP